MVSYFFFSFSFSKVLFGVVSEVDVISCGGSNFLSICCLMGRVGMYHRKEGDA